MSHGSGRGAAILLLNSKNCRVSNISVDHGIDAVRIVGGGSHRIVGVEKRGLGQAVTAVDADDLFIDRIRHLGINADDPIVSAMREDIKHGNKTGFLEKMNSISAKIPLDKIESFLRICDKIF